MESTRKPPELNGGPQVSGGEKIMDDGYDYERWSGMRTEVFNQLGVVRSLIEDGYSEEERNAIIDNNLELFHRVISDDYLVFPQADKEALTAALEGLRLLTPAALDLPNRLAELIRHADQKVRHLAPPLDRRNEIDSERGEDDKHPDHEMLKGKEPELIYLHIVSVLSAIESGDSYSPYDLVGTLQTLYTIVEKLRDKIDSVEIDVGLRDAEDCVEQIKAARKKMVIEGILKMSPGRTSKLPGSQAVGILKDVADIAKHLSEVKINSV